MQKTEYTLSVYTENKIGLISKIAALFSRRKINLLSLNISPSEIDNIYRFTIVIIESEPVVRNIVRQLEKLVDVFIVYFNTNEEIIWQQLALFKVPTQTIIKEVKVERLLREFGATTVVIRDDFTIFEVSGQDGEINKLVDELHKYGLIEFVKSSRIAIIKNSEGIHKKVLAMEKNHPIPQPIFNEYLDKKNVIFDI